MTIFLHFLDAFRAVPIARRRSEALYQAEADLLLAEAQFEDAKSQRTKLRRRVDRLKSETHLNVHLLGECSCDTLPSAYPPSSPPAPPSQEG